MAISPEPHIPQRAGNAYRGVFGESESGVSFELRSSLDEVLDPRAHYRGLLPGPATIRVEEGFDRVGRAELFMKGAGEGFEGLGIFAGDDKRTGVDACFRALKRETVLPSTERGPVDLRALRRLASICLVDAMGFGGGRPPGVTVAVEGWGLRDRGV